MKTIKSLVEEYQKLTSIKNTIKPVNQSVADRYRYPILTANHVPPHWIYDFNKSDNPYVQVRLGINAVFNAGAILHKGKHKLIARVEGHDRKSFFAIAESENGIDSFQFNGYPIEIPQLERPDTNIYDMRLTQHEDGYIYGLFCTERRPVDAPEADQAIAEASCGIVRTEDLVHWERLPDLKTNGSQQRNVVLHPEFIDGQYGLYTRPQDGFIDAGTGGGIGWCLTPTMENAEARNEIIIDPKMYHTINEVKNGQGPPPIKTNEGWIHLAHGVRNTAAGLRYVLYAFMTDLHEPWRITHRPGGYFMAPEGEERVGDVSNVLFANGWIVKESGEVFIYYASSDTRTHVATTSIEKLIDYCKHTPPDAIYSHASVHQRIALIKKNEKTGLL